MYESHACTLPKLQGVTDFRERHGVEDAFDMEVQAIDQAVLDVAGVKHGPAELQSCVQNTGTGTYGRGQRIQVPYAFCVFLRVGPAGSGSQVVVALQGAGRRASQWPGMPQ